MEAKISKTVDRAVAWAGGEERKRFLERLRERKLARAAKHLPNWALSVKRKMPTTASIRDSWVGKLMGKSVMRRECWSFKPHNAALGLSLGLLISWTPTVGIQMPIALVACVLFRANIPLAIISTWFSNPVCYLAALVVGCLVIGQPLPEIGVLWNSDWGVELMTQLFRDYFWPLWAGAFLLGGLSAVVLYFSAYGFAHWQRRHHFIRALKERNAMNRERWRNLLEERHLRRAETRFKRDASRLARKAARAAASSASSGALPKQSATPPPLANE